MTRIQRYTLDLTVPDDPLAAAEVVAKTIPAWRDFVAAIEKQAGAESVTSSSAAVTVKGPRQTAPKAPPAASGRAGHGDTVPVAQPVHEAMDTRPNGGADPDAHARAGAQAAREGLQRLHTGRGAP